MLRLGFMVRKTLMRAVAAMADRRVPLRFKLMAAAAVLAIVSPLNILGDIPLLGLFDDAGLVLLVLSWFLRASSPYLATLDV